MSSRLPALGPRGEGWVGAQAILFVAIAGFGLRDLAGRAPGEGPPLAQVIVGAAAVVLGAVIAVRAVLDLGANLSPFPRPLAGAELVQTGAYRLVRHPIYTGLVLGAVGWGVATGSIGALVAAGLLFLLFDGKSRREEAWLAEVFPDYPAYRGRTRRLVPWLY